MITRLEKFAKRMTRDVAIDLDEELSTFIEQLEDAQSDLEQLQTNLETWSDEDSDAESKADARQEIQTILEELPEKLRDIQTALAAST